MIDTVKNGKKTELNETMFIALIARLTFILNKCKLKFMLLPSRSKKVLYKALLALIIVFLFLRFYRWLFPDRVTAHESLLESLQCPACYGSSVCGLFYDGQIKMSGMSKFRMLDSYNPKNVHYAQLQRGDVVLKKMATDYELEKLDKQICHDAKKPEDCNVARAISHTSWALPFSNNPLTSEVLQTTKRFMFSCPSTRLLDKMWSHFQEYKKGNQIHMLDKMHVLYTAMVNQEPLLLQTFPKSEGWPFPQYIGACGRVAILENGGEQLASFYNSEFSVRAALAYELLKIADTLTSKSDYSLYLADVAYENFAVDYRGKVTVVDLEHIMVVDQLDVQSRAPPGWETPHQSKFDYCEGGNCLIISTKELCAHRTSDHNYYAICRGILSHYARDPDMPDGLLHSLPDNAFEWHLEFLLNECANPSPKTNRFKIKNRLMKALQGLKDDNQQMQEFER